jgi:hypothetical protein
MRRGPRVHSADSLRAVDIKMDDSDLMKKRRGIRVLISAVGDMMDGSEASPTGGSTWRVTRWHGQRLAGTRWPGRPDAPNSMGFLPTGTEWNDELT